MTYEEAVAEIEGMAKEAVEDSDGEIGYEDACHDIALSYVGGLAENLPTTIRRDIARCWLGWDPEDDKDLYVLNGLA